MTAHPYFMLFISIFSPLEYYYHHHLSIIYGVRTLATPLPTLNIVGRTHLRAAVVYTYN